MATIWKETKTSRLWVKFFFSFQSLTNKDIMRENRVRLHQFYIKSFCKNDLFLLLCWQTFIFGHASPLRRPIRTNAIIIYTHKYTENHTKETVDISHRVCHNAARQIVGIKWSQSVRCQIQTEKSVANRVINKDRWFKQVRKMLALDKRQQKQPTNLY